jgi:hypothetical protein
MAHLKDNIEYPPHTNPFFRRVSCAIDPGLLQNMGVSGNGGIASTSQPLGNPPVANHGDVEVIQTRRSKKLFMCVVYGRWKHCISFISSRWMCCFSNVFRSSCRSFMTFEQKLVIDNIGSSCVGSNHKILGKKLCFIGVEATNWYCE